MTCFAKAKMADNFSVDTFTKNVNTRANIWSHIKEYGKFVFLKGLWVNVSFSTRLKKHNNPLSVTTRFMIFRKRFSWNSESPKIQFFLFVGWSLKCHDGKFAKSVCGRNWERIIS